MAEAYDEMAANVGWPGFAYEAIPLALYDDEHVYVIRHPGLIEPFEPMRGLEDGWVADTVPPDFAANTDLDLAGTRSAVVGVGSGAWDVPETAALLVHEAFHAYQTIEHPEWTANEVDLFTYPYGSARLLEARRLEGGALRRAISAPDSVRELCWAQEFLRQRADRFRRLPEEHVAYERGTELREGLARYAEGRARGADPRLPANGFLPEDVRERGYEVGHALAVLLDALAPGWKRELIEAEEPIALDEALAAAIGDVEVRDCRASPDEAARTRGVAVGDSADLVERRRRALASFEGAAGWRIEVVADEEPMAVERFDPLNVRVVGAREVLHDRWIRLSTGSGSVEVRDRTALTHGSAGHPLFAGVERLVVTGLPEPTPARAGDTLRVEGNGLTLIAVGAEVERDGQHVVVRLAGPDS